MAPLKDISIEAIKNLPEHCTLEDIMYEINLVGQVMEGYKDAVNKKTITTDELLKKVKQWGK